MLFRLTSLFAILTLLPLSGWAETFIREYTYQASDSDSKITARDKGLGQLRALVLQEVGTSIRHVISVSRHGTGERSEQEFLEAMTIGVSSTSILQERWNGESYYVKARIVVDTRKVLEQLDQAIRTREQQSRQQHQLSEQQKALEALRADVVFLKQALEDARRTAAQAVPEPAQRESDRPVPSKDEVLSLASLLPLLQAHKQSDSSTSVESPNGSEQSMMELVRHMPMIKNPAGQAASTGQGTHSIVSMSCLLLSNPRHQIAVVNILVPGTVKPIRSWFLAADGQKRLADIKGQQIKSDWKVQLAQPSHRPVALFSVTQWLEHEQCWKLDINHLQHFITHHRYVKE